MSWIAAPGPPPELPQAQPWGSVALMALGLLVFYLAARADTDPTRNRPRLVRALFTLSGVLLAAALVLGALITNSPLA